MIETFKNARRLKSAYVKNSFIFWIKTIPIIGKLIPSSLYGNRFVEVLASLYFIAYTIVSFCFTHLFYALGVFGIAAGIRFGTEMQFFENLWLFLALIGIFSNPKLFDPSEDKYYGIMLMRMDAREYILSDLIYYSIRQFTGYSIVLLLVMNFYEVPFLNRLMLLVFSIFTKYVSCFIKLLFVRKNKSGLHSGLGFVFVIGIVVLMFFSLKDDIIIPNKYLYIATAVMVLLGILSLAYLWNYKEYKNVCKVFLSEKSMIDYRKARSGEAKKKTLTEDVAKNLIKADETVVTTQGFSSNASGYKYFNQIFEKRHASILGKRTKLISGGIIVVGIVAIGIVTMLPHFDMDAPSSYSWAVYVMPLTMYFINTGEVLASAMFYNCDAAMLTYNFYRQPDTILGLFKERLKTVIKHNIIPAGLLSIGFVILVLISPVENKTSECITFLILIPSLSVFFSVHRLVIYYLLQPFTVGQEEKNTGYHLINTATYVVSYLLMQNTSFIVQLGISPIFFGVGTLIFSIIYVVVALVLVYKFAPKLFKLR